MNRIALVLVAALGLGLTACPDDPKKRPIGETCGDDSECIDGLCLAGVCLDPEADEDLDGLLNKVEGSLGSNPFNPDSDYDGVADGDEVNGIDPRDSDGDSKADILESLVVDADGDCLPDELDPDNGTVATDLSPAIPALCSRNGVCRASIGNVRLECDAQKHPVCIYTDIPTYEAEESTCDGLDNDCDGRADEGFRDSDGDAIADCADDDLDGDGDPQTSDNCPELANDDQANADGDDLGDACDPPAAPKLGAFTPASPSNDKTPTAHGTGEKLSIVRVYTDASCTTKIGEGAADAAGAFSFDVTLGGAGAFDVYVQAENSAGLLSECILGGHFEVDLTAPDAPRNTVVRSRAWTESGATFDFSGLVEAFSAVDIFPSDDCTGEGLHVVAGEDGAFSVSGELPNTTGAISYAVTDLAGNTSTCLTGPALFGEVTVDVHTYGKPVAGIPVQFTFPDGSPLSEVATGDDGLAKAKVFAGCGFTAALDETEGYVRWVTVLDVAPGQVIPLAIAGSVIGLDRQDSVAYTWPTPPEGAYYVQIYTPCGQQRVYLDGPMEGWSTYYYGGCLGLTTFDAAVVIYDGAGLPVGFATAQDNLVPENVDHQTMVDFGDVWRTDFETFSVTFENVETASPLDFVAELSTDEVVYGATGFSDFDVGTVTFEGTFPKIPGGLYDYRARVAHLAANGRSGSRAEVGHAAGASHTIDVATLPPRLFDAGWLYESGIDTGGYVGFQWAGEAGLTNKVEAGLFEGSFYSQFGTLEWKVVMAPSGDSGEVLFPAVNAEFPGAAFLDAIYYTYDANVTFWDYPEDDGYGAFVDGCEDDIVKCFEPATKGVFTSCCTNGSAR